MPDWDGVEHREGVRDATYRPADLPNRGGRRQSDYTEREWERKQWWDGLTLDEKIRELRDDVAWARRQRGRKRLDINVALMRTVEHLARLEREEAGAR